LAGVFCCTVFSADSASVKEDVKPGLSEDILVDDDDEDLLKLLKETDTLKAQTPVETKAPDSLKAEQPVVKSDTVQTKKAALDDVLILEGGADDLLGTVPKPKDTAVVKSANDTTKAAVIESTDTEPVVSTPAVVEKPKIAAPVVAAKIEDADSINFAKNLKDYRNPKIAMLLSLIFPGAGEVYAKNYVRAGLFGALEVGVIVSGALVKAKSNKMRDDAHKFADQHYSADSLISYYTKFKSVFFGTSGDLVNEADSIFYSVESNIDPSRFSKNIKGFYDIIKDPLSPYIRGWDDITPRVDNTYEIYAQDSAYSSYRRADSGSFDSSFFFILKSDPDSVPHFGISNNQQVYNKKISKAEDRYKNARTIFFLMVLNRIASSIDAGICAKAYNDKLLGKKSAWQNINIKDITVATGNGYAPGYALEVRF